MNKKSIRINFSSLANDYIYAYEKVDEFFSGDFRDLTAFQRQADKVESRVLDRESLAAVLLRQNQDFGCGSKVRDNIERLIQDRACAVVTGQQVGLFSGPLYTIYKSLTAIKLAEHLDESLSGCCVPVFWLASDDHDFEEIDHINLLSKDNRIEKIHYRPPLPNLKIPASKRILTEEVSNCIQRLDDLTRDSEFKPIVLSRLNDAYQPCLTFAEAFARWMTHLFKSSGLIFVDASDPELKKLGKKVFAHEITEHSPSTKRALEASEKLRHAGYHRQIQLHEGKLNLFLADQERQTILSKGDDYLIKEAEKICKKRELLDVLDEKPEIFSPNVLFRPIYQDALFPTIAYIGGPGEIAYFAQMKGVYESFGLPMPVIYPRKTVTLIEKNVENVLESFGVDIQDMWKDADRIISESVKEQIPGSIDEVFRTASLHLEQEFQTIKKEVMTFDPALERSIDLASRRMDKQMKFLEQKVLKAAKKRDKTITQQLLKAKNSLFPKSRFQERVFNIVPFLMKYDYSFLDELYRTIDMENYDHQVIKL